jgi:hypothetical protein
MAIVEPAQIQIPTNGISRLLPVLLAAGLVATCSTTGTHRTQGSQPTPQSEVQDYIDHYLADPQTQEVFKEAIRRGVVVEGMCPHQAIAAAGFPGPYMVKKDRKRWSSDVPPPVVVDAQCAQPDESVIELMFRNKTQFSSVEAQVFRVRFIRGKVTTIDRKGFNE